MEAKAVEVGHSGAPGVQKAARGESAGVEGQDVRRPPLHAAIP
jgi:hypothetical protein